MMIQAMRLACPQASPLPVPPAEVAGDPVEVMVPVSFFLRGR